MTVVSSPRRRFFAFNGKVASLLEQAAQMEKEAIETIAAADTDWARWLRAYRAAQGNCSYSCRNARAEIESARFRRKLAQEELRAARGLLDEAIQAEQAGLREWGLIV